MSKYLLHSEVSGQGEAVVLLHGLLSSTRFWKKVVPELSKTRRVIALDLLGFGRSPKPKEIKYSLDDHLSSIKATLETLGVDSKVTMVGHSMGALIAASFAAEYPDLVKNLILISPPVYSSKEQARKMVVQQAPLPEHLLYGSLSKWVCLICCEILPITRILSPLFIRNVPFTVAQDVTLHNYYSYSGSLENIVENQNLCGDLTKIAAPVLVLYGLRDKTTPRENLESLKRCSQKLEIKYTEGGHQLPLDDPQAVIEAVMGLD